jgi:uncharacterized repeat protein (TIGR03803 family)
MSRHDFLRWALVLSLTVLCAHSSPAQVVTVIKNFTGGNFSAPGDGAAPTGALLYYGGALYGMAAAGGNRGDGVIFRIGVDGTGYTVLRSLGNGSADGAQPIGSLIQSGGLLYGMTESGGLPNGGIIFSIAPDGTGFTTLHSFTNGPTDGAGPVGSLTKSGSVFYGTTSSGGSVPNANGLYQFGAIFKINTDGTGFTLLHSFGNPGDGAVPYFGSLVVSGSTIYGTTSAGGANSFGTIYKINTDGTGYAILHTFTASANDGAEPFGSVILVGSSLYGMTKYGGSTGTGAIYKIGLDGSGFGLIRSLFLNPSDAGNPQTELLLGTDGKLYGMTPAGGANALGTLFGLAPDGTDYAVYHSFVGPPSDGATPFADDLTQVGADIYGMTTRGGANDYGTIFMFTPSVPEPSPFLFVAGAAIALAAHKRWKHRTLIVRQLG